MNRELTTSSALAGAIRTILLPYSFSTLNSIIDFRILALSDRSKPSTTVRVAVAEKPSSLPSSIVSISITSEPSFCHRFALCAFSSETCGKLLLFLISSGISASSSGISMGRKRRAVSQIDLDVTSPLPQRGRERKRLGVRFPQHLHVEPCAWAEIRIGLGDTRQHFSRSLIDEIVRLLFF